MKIKNNINQSFKIIQNFGNNLGINKPIIQQMLINSAKTSPPCPLSVNGEGGEKQNTALNPFPNWRGALNNVKFAYSPLHLWRGGGGEVFEQINDNK